MTKTTGYARIAVIFLFILTFTVVGWSAPVIYATYAPQDQVINVHEYTAEDTTVNSEFHYVCFDRTVTNGVPAKTITELYLINELGQRIAVERGSDDVFFQEGRETVIIPRDLPDDLRVGEYRYVVNIKLEMANDRVTREVTYQSEKFNVTNGTPAEDGRAITC